MIIRAVVVTVVMSLLFLPTGVLAEIQTVTAHGMGAIIQNDHRLTRETALQDAFRRAVEQALGTMVASETVVQNLQVIRDDILVKSQGYIQKYNIMNEGPENNLYGVTIQATVSEKPLKNDLAALGLLMSRVGKPRTLFMIAEQNIGEEIAVFWWSLWGRGGSEYKGQIVNMAASETAMKEEFLAKGFRVVDTSAATGRFEISNAYHVADLTNEAVQAYGRSLGAEIVIKGKALAKEGPRTPGSPVGSYLAEITASAIRVDNGQLLGSARGQGVARHVSQPVGGNEALSRAAKNVSSMLMEQITTAWTVETAESKVVQLTIRGLESLNDLKKFKELLKSHAKGVQSVMQRSFDGRVAILELDGKSTAEEVGHELAGQGFENFEVQVSAVTANTLDISVTNKTASVPKSLNR